MSKTNFLNNVKTTRVLSRNAGTAGTKKATIVDMADYDSACFVVAFDDVVNESVITVRAAGADVNDTAEMTVLSGAVGKTATAADHDNKLVIFDLVKPTFRFIEFQIVIADQNAPIDGVIAHLYNAKSMPVTQDSTVVTSTTVAAPAAA